MRYVLYNTSKKDATISEELEFIENYLDLMRIRSSERVSIAYSAHIIYEDVSIAPMLFLPFIENCFKHGVSGQIESPIEIKILQDGRNIIFYARNKFFNKSNQMGSEYSHGIGIQNTKRRLELLYPNKYTLEITRNENFEILLKIDLNDD